MPAQVIDGRAYAAALKDEVRMEVKRLEGAGVPCGLATVMVGTNYGAVAYERRLRRVAGELHIGYRHYFLAEDATLESVVRVVEFLNADPAVNGILMLRPLPPLISEAE